MNMIFWAWAIILLMLNVIPLGNQAENVFHSGKFIIRLDYLIHAFLFMGFTLIYIYGQIKSKPVFKRNGLYKLFLISTGLSILSELIQLILPYRTFNIIDLFSNLLGVTIGIVIVSLFFRQNQTEL